MKTIEIETTDGQRFEMPYRQYDTVRSILFLMESKGKTVERMQLHERALAPEDERAEVVLQTERLLHVKLGNHTNIIEALTEQSNNGKH